MTQTLYRPPHYSGPHAAASAAQRFNANGVCTRIRHSRRITANPEVPKLGVKDLSAQRAPSPFSPGSKNDRARFKFSFEIPCTCSVLNNRVFCVLTVLSVLIFSITYLESKCSGNPSPPLGTNLITYYQEITRHLPLCEPVMCESQSET